MAVRAAPATLSTTVCDVPAGATTPNHKLVSKSGIPSEFFLSLSGKEYAVHGHSRQVNCRTRLGACLF
jgi:hypothetical protein